MLKHRTGRVHVNIAETTHTMPSLLAMTCDREGTFNGVEVPVAATVGIGHFDGENPSNSCRLPRGRPFVSSVVSETYPPYNVQIMSFVLFSLHHIVLLGEQGSRLAHFGANTLYTLGRVKPENRGRRSIMRITQTVPTSWCVGWSIVYQLINRKSVGGGQCSSGQ